MPTAALFRLVFQRLVWGCLCFVAIVHEASAQTEEGENLVPNPGFEQLTSPLDGYTYNDTLVAAWFNINRQPPAYPYATPDFFYNAEGGRQAAIVYVRPRVGRGVAGVITYLPRLRNFREYIGVKLNQPLEKGGQYLFTAYITSGRDRNFSNRGANGFGLLLSLQPPQQRVYEPLLHQPQFSVGQPFYSERWQRLEYRFVADSAYAYLTLGNFHPDGLLETFSVNVEATVEPQAYVFIDEVRLVKTAGIAPKPNKDAIFLPPALAEEALAQDISQPAKKPKPKPPSVVSGREVLRQGEMGMTTREVELRIWDHKFVDGDVISLRFNGEWVLRRHELTSRKKKVKLTLQPDQANYLVLYAHNLGLDPPNTAALRIKEKGRPARTFTVSSNLQQCGAIWLNYEGQQDDAANEEAATDTGQ